VTLLAFAAERRAAAPLLVSARRCRSIVSAHTALSSKPAARRGGCGRTMGRTDGQTTLDHLMDLIRILREQCQ